MERVEAIKKMAWWSAVAAVLAVIWRVRMAFLLILPAAYQVIYWPDLLERQAGAVLMAVIPAWYVFDGLVRSFKSHRKRVKKVRAAQKAAKPSMARP